jgi:hypothetical protein
MLYKCLSRLHPHISKTKMKSYAAFQKSNIMALKKIVGLWRPLEVKEVLVYFFQHFCLYSKAVRFHYAEGLYRKETRSRLHEHTVHCKISLMFLDIILRVLRLEVSEWIS